MRGYIYEVGKRPDDIGIIRETYFYDLAGAEVGKDYFILTDKVKENIFSTRFKKLKETINEMKLHDFATMDSGSLKALIDDPYDNAIYEEKNSFNSIDRWIRIAETGVKYYVGNVVGMH